MKRILIVTAFVFTFTHMGFGQTFTDASFMLNPTEDHTILAGASAVDFNNDGLVDLYNPGKLYLNTGTEFQDVLLSTNIVEGGGIFGAIFGDYDNDGYLDVLFEDLPSPSRLYRNNRDKTFTQTNNEANLFVRRLAQGSAWADFNRDGRLDLFVNNDRGENQLFKNVGNGGFQDISKSAGVEIQGNSYGMAWGDYNNDGLPDIFVAPCSFVASQSVKHLFRNDGDETFTDVSVQAGVSDSLASWGTVWLDYDNDGDLDIYIANTENQSRRGYNRLYRNEGDGTFSNVSAEAGVRGEPDENSYGISTADFDSDGWLDIYVANQNKPHRLYRNNGDGSFTDVSVSAGVTGPFHYAVAVADVNNDGWVDIYTAGEPGNQLWVNDGGNNHWLQVETRGVNSNHYGVSARVELYASDLRQIREVKAGDGFCSQNLNLAAHFGLDNETNVDSLIVRWPSGVVDRLENLDVDRKLTVVEGIGINQRPNTFRLLQPQDGFQVGTGSGSVRFSWQAAADPEMQTLTYRLILNGPEGSMSFPDITDTFFELEAEVLQQNQFCMWTVDVSDGHSITASTDVLVFGDARCQPLEIFAQLPETDLSSDDPRSSGANWVDFDGNGTLDIFVADGGEHNDLHSNNGDGTFTKIDAGDLTGDFGGKIGATWGDIDNDGDLDVFAADFSGENSLYRNEGGVFVEIFAPTNELPEDRFGWLSSSWIDVENDGDLDLYAASFLPESGGNAFYKNDVSGNFSRVTEGEIATDLLSTFSVAWADYDNDGDSDLFLGNEGDNSLYVNHGDGTFVKITTGEIVNDGGGSQSASWGDYDNDGDQDLFVANNQGEPNFLYSNNGDGTFSKVLQGAIVTERNTSGNSSWADFDNDGDLDLLIGNAGFIELFSNEGNGTFEQVDVGIFRVNSARSSIWGDYDRDGDLDLFVIGDRRQNFLYTNMGNENHWLNIQCLGIVSNSSAIGTKVRVKAVIDGRPTWQMREISSQTGYLSQNSLHAAFGLGDVALIDSVMIQWPSGQVDITTGVAVNRFYTAIEGQGVTSVESAEPVPTNFSLKQNYPNPFNPTTTISYTLPSKTDVKLRIFNLLGQEIRLLIDEEQGTGSHKVQWDGRDELGRTVATGVYVYRLESEEFVRSRKMILLR
ncbi:T9SS type A sorting domain-containing protein [candidate division KSB1 bacterium]|nr:T9SS type A sorting domain-containing protein [candidate division KSB1 bacterium]NIR70581.1 T9SS type A sorting domain-containing protein [candidate division KSB1 bacterium]NIS27717.1 T9SS type A sorting domain-containing protein [candidate division KSB1 bacterium]NIT74545.1 T9SS type A sorting domain-containing protein [candidate division KSB1 bacterium]NIU28370.1 T9SS type A sorting domain-containing protein [candidate division KSB1 bacterium]